MTTVADTMWLWGHPAGTANTGYTLSTPSRMGPVEGAEYYGVRNIFFVPWREAMPLEETTAAGSDLREIGWSAEYGRIAASDTDGDELGALIDLSRRHPNVGRVVLDDFFASGNLDRPEPPRLAGPYRDLTPDRLAAVRHRLHTEGPRPLSTWMVLYTHQMHPDIKPYLDEFDGIMLWFWWQKDLDNFERRLETFLDLTEGKRRLMGCYVYDFGTPAESDPGRAIWQLDRQLDLLREGTIEGTCLHTNVVADVGFAAPAAARQWVAEHGSQAARPTELPGTASAVQ